MAFPGFGGGEHGFFALANSTLEAADNRNPPHLEGPEHEFLTKEFPTARDRTNALASTVGTAGSFLLTLIALAVALAGGLTDKSAKLVEATNKSAQLAAHCSDQDQATRCSKLRTTQAAEAVKQAKDSFTETVTLTNRQALAGGLILIAFFLGLIAQLVNPVPGPRAHLQSANGIAEWKSLMDRYKIKRLWIIPSFGFQLAAGVVIIWTAWEIWH